MEGLIAKKPRASASSKYLMKAKNKMATVTPGGNLSSDDDEEEVENSTRLRLDNISYSNLNNAEIGVRDPFINNYPNIKRILQEEKSKFKLRHTHSGTDMHAVSAPDILQNMRPLSNNQVEEQITCHSARNTASGGEQKPKIGKRTIRSLKKSNRNKLVSTAHTDNTNTVPQMMALNLSSSTLKLSDVDAANPVEITPRTQITVDKILSDGQFVVTCRKGRKFEAKILREKTNPLYIGRYKTEAAANAACERVLASLQALRR